jgi:arylsulfatase B
MPSPLVVPTIDTAVVLPPPPLPPNLLVLIADDVGIPSIGSFGQPADAVPNTPRIDALVDQGMRFTNAYANPTCTPTRFTALTGRYARRNGVGRPIFREEDFETSLGEVSLAQVLVALGKWHLSSDASATSYDHPLLWGFEHHGFLQKLDYWDYTRNDVGVVSIDPTYQTTALADDTIFYANTTEPPWLIWSGFLAAHTPLHGPPAELNPSGVSDTDPDRDRYFAMIEAMDIEIGRVLDSIDPGVLENTVVVFFGDNGTVSSFIPSMWEPRRGKGSTYEGGVNVPFVVMGPGIAAGMDNPALVHTADLFPTLVELAGIPPESFSVSTVGHWGSVASGAREPWLDGWSSPEPPVVLDGASLVPTLLDPSVPGPREYVYTERFWPKGAPPYPNELRSLRDGRFKLSDQEGVVELFDLEGRHDDGPDLLLEELSDEASEAYGRLQGVMNAHSTTLQYEQ